MLKILIISTAVFVFLEFFVFLLFHLLKKKFQWLINSDDINPKFNKKNLDNFLKKNYDEITGWDRKPNSKGFEISNKRTYFTINKLGFRGKKIFKKNKYNVFGDSFAFSRYVNDNETWEHNLAKKYKKNVLNFGVGNFGLDQAFLKYLKIKKKLNKKPVIFCVVPETIARVFSYWKHYREFKNIFGFKPLLNFKKKKIEIIKVPKIKIRNISKNTYKFKNSFLEQLKKKDVFYELKFKKNIFYFPYIFCFLRNIKLNSNIFYNLILNLIFKVIKKNYKNEFYIAAYAAILKNNIKESHSYYEKKDFRKKFKDLLNYINVFFKKENIEYKILIVPQYFDLKLSNSRKKYTKFYKQINNVNVIDLTEDILKFNDWQKYYFIDKYGGHLNKSGNKKLSEIIHKRLA